ncbi:MAG TPA: heparin lyase I family protein [Archangium sp.]|nr:heparin lyase I family protein [Archangium sp.]
MKPTTTRMWMAISVVLVFISYQASHADITWRGDYSSNNLYQYAQVQCGSYSGVDGGAGTCPDGLQIRNQQTTTTGNLCPNPGEDGAGCRFFLAEPPKPAASTGTIFRPAGAALRARVAQGDTAPALSNPWGSNARNELVYPRIGGVAKTYGLNEDVYYGFNAFVPSAAEFPEAGTYSSGLNYWHSILQFHSVGSCGSPNVQIGITRSDTSTSAERGSDYVFSLQNISAYPGNSVRLWPTFPRTMGLQRERWHQFVLRVKWATAACDNGGGSCNWNAPNGGVIELWHNGSLAYQGRHQTLFDYNPAQCADDGSKTGLMGAYLKQGLYRHNAIPGTENIYLNGLRTGSTRADVDPAPQTIDVLGSSGTTTVGGIAVDKRESGDGAAFVAGSTDGSVEGNPKGYGDAYLRRINSDGSTAWSVQQALSSNNGRDSATGAAFSNVDNSVVIIGETAGSLPGYSNPSGSGIDDAFLAKFNHGTGTPIFVKQLTRVNSQTIRGIAVDQGNGDIYVGGSTYEAGNSQSYAYLAKFNASGHQLWYNATFIPNGQVSAIHIAADGGIYVGSTVGIQTNIAQVSSSGAVLWSQGIGAAGFNTYVTDLKTDSSGGLFVVGITNGRVDGGSQPSSPQSFDAFIFRLIASSGATNWVRQYGGSTDDFARGVAVDNRGVAYVTGSFKVNRSASGCAMDFSCRDDDSEYTVHRFNVLGDRELIDSMSTEWNEAAGPVEFALNRLYIGGSKPPSYGGFGTNGILRRY